MSHAVFCARTRLASLAVLSRPLMSHWMRTSRESDFTRRFFKLVIEAVEEHVGKESYFAGTSSPRTVFKLMAVMYSRFLVDACSLLIHHE